MRPTGMLGSTLRLGNRLTFVGGKGGVGKTTIAAALGLDLADAGEPVLVVSTDPAHSLGDALGTGLGREPRVVPGAPRLRAMEVDADHERSEFVRTHGRKLTKLLERGTYLDGEDLAAVEELAIPGIDEIAALLRLAVLARRSTGRIIVDTAPTGHTLRLLELPRTALAWLDALDAVEAKHTAVSAAFAGSAPDDDVTRWLAGLRLEIETFAAMLSEPRSTRIVLVTTTEPVVAAETRRYRAGLRILDIAEGGVVVNRCTARPPATEGEAPVVFVPPMPEPPVGLAALRRLAAAAGSLAGSSGGRTEGSVRIEVGDAYTLPADRRLYVVGGKGGVGKSTVAAALAVGMADGGRRVALLGVDPAGSLGDVLEFDVGREITGHPRLPGLHARQIDASAAWSGFRRRHLDRIDEVFDALLPAGLTAPLDRAVLERAIDLAPPGVDELVALVEVIDHTEDRGHDALVVDTAPTGHLLRLLELPDVVLGWVHALLRMLLKYREAIRLGAVGEELLGLARGVRTLRDLLRDPARTCFLAVAAPDDLNVPETGRLLAGVRRRGMAPTGLLVNRALSMDGGVRPEAAAALDRLLRVDATLPAAAAAEVAGPPIGIEALRAFSGGWRRVRNGPGPAR